MPILAAGIVRNFSFKAAFDLDKQLGLGWYARLTQQLRQDHDIRLPSRGGSYDLGQIAKVIREQYILKGMTAEPGNHLQAAYYLYYLV